MSLVNVTTSVLNATRFVIAWNRIGDSIPIIPVRFRSICGRGNRTISRFGSITVRITILSEPNAKVVARLGRQLNRKDRRKGDSVTRECTRIRNSNVGSICHLDIFSRTCKVFVGRLLHTDLIVQDVCIARAIQLAMHHVHQLTVLKVIAAVGLLQADVQMTLSEQPEEIKLKIEANLPSQPNHTHPLPYKDHYQGQGNQCFLLKPNLDGAAVPRSP